MATEGNIFHQSFQLRAYTSKAGYELLDLVLAQQCTLYKGITSFISQDQLGNQRHIYAGYWASSREFPPAKLLRRMFRAAFRSASSVKPQATHWNTFPCLLRPSTTPHELQV